MNNILEDKLYYEKRWYALRTKSRFEKQVDLRLKGADIESFLPLRTIMRKWKDRRKKVDFPLFPGYTFVRMALLEKRKVLQTAGVVSFVGNKDAEPLLDADIASIRKFIEAEIDYDPYPYLVPGIDVVVRRGPLKDVQGTLVSKKNKHRLILNLNIINNSIATEIDAEDVAVL